MQRKMTLLFCVLMSLCCLIIGCSGQTEASDSQEESNASAHLDNPGQMQMAGEDIVKRAQDIVGEPDQHNESLLNYDNPEVVQIKELPSADQVGYEEGVTLDNGPYWRVTFSSDQDAIIGPLNMYFDSDGVFLGSGYRD